MKTFLIIFCVIIAYIFIGVLCYWTLILSGYKKSKTKNSLKYWLNEICEESCSGFYFSDTREQGYFWFSVFWIVALPFYSVVLLFYYISCLFSNIIKKILKVNKLEDESKT